MNPLLSWWNAADEAEKRLLAAGAKSTYSSLHFAAKAYRNKGRLKLSPELASRLAKASEVINKTRPHLPVLKQTDLSQTCARCAIAKRCTE